MATKQFSANLEFTEREFRAPVRTNLNETKAGAVLPASVGYAQTPILIENESQLIANFGYPTDNNYKFWYDCSGYLKNGSTLNVVRPLKDNAKNYGVSVSNAGVVAKISKEDLYNEEVAMNTLDNSLGSEGKLEIYNRYVSKTNDIAVAVVSNTTAYAAPLFADFKLVNGLSYFFKKPVNFVNESGTTPDIKSLLGRTSAFASNTYAHIFQGTDFVVASTAVASANQNKVFIDTDITNRLSITGTYGTTLVIGTKYLMTFNHPTATVTLPVEAISTTTFKTLADDSALVTTGITSVDVKSDANVAVTTVTGTVAVTKSSNCFLSIQDIDGTWGWEDLDLFIPSGYFTVDSKYYKIQKVEGVLGTTTTKIYDFVLGTNKFGELEAASGTAWHLIIDGNDYNIDVDGKLYQYTSPNLTVYGADDATKKPQGYNMVYTKDSTGVKVLSKIVPKYLVDGLYTNDGSIVAVRDVVSPTPNFSKNEVVVLVFRKEFVSGRYDLVESFTGNYNYNSKNSSGASNYIETIINKNSKFIYCNADTTDNADLSLTPGINTSAKGIVDCMMIDTSNSEYDRVMNMRAGESDTENYLTAVDLRLAADEFSIRGNTFVNLLIGYDNGLTSGYFDDMSEIAKESGTALAVISYDSGDYAGQKNDVIRAAVVDALGNKRQDTTSGALTSFNDYTFVIATSKLMFDKYNNKDRWMGLAGDIAGRMTANDAVNGSWYAVAGTERGIVSNYKRLLWSPSATNQNELSRQGLNFIVNDKEIGYAYMFEYMTNTTENKITAEANVRRLLITLKDYLRSSLKGTFYSFNDAVERNAVLYKITDTFENIKARRGLYDFRLVCDETNNTADVINQQQFVVDVLVQPTRLVKYIKVNFSIFDAGFNLQEFEL